MKDQIESPADTARWLKQALSWGCPKEVLAASKRIQITGGPGSSTGLQEIVARIVEVVTPCASDLDFDRTIDRLKQVAELIVDARDCFR